MYENFMYSNKFLSIVKLINFYINFFWFINKNCIFIKNFSLEIIMLCLTFVKNMF